MMKLFGTDGVRGVAGEELTEALASALGSAAAELAPPERPQVLIVRDTRESGPALERALAPASPPPAATSSSPASSRLPRPRSSSAGSASTSRSSSRPPTTRGATTGSSSSVPTGTKFAASAEQAIEARVDELGAGGEPRRPGPPGRCGARGRARRLPAGALVELPPRPLRAPPDPRLCERRHPRGGAGDLSPPRCRGRGDRRRARRSQHQRGLRLDPPRGSRGPGRRLAVGQRRLRIRWRRGPRRRGRRRRQRARRRRADRARGAPPRRAPGGCPATASPSP